MKKTNRNLRIENKRINVKNKRRNNQIALMLLTTNLFFILFSLLYDITNNNIMKSNSTLILTAHLLAYSNNSFNFAFYALFSSQYRSILFSIINKNRHFFINFRINKRKLDEKINLNSQNIVKSKNCDNETNYDSIIHKLEFIDDE